jgi:hypothetical protein
MITAATIAFKTRNVPSAFNESQHIANAIFLLIFFAVIIVPLDILVQDNPNASIIIQGIGQCFLGIMLLVVLYGPKIYYIVSGKSNDKSMLELRMSTTQGTGSGSVGRRGSADPLKKPSSTPVTATSKPIVSTGTNPIPNAGIDSASASSVELPPITATSSAIPLSACSLLDKFIFDHSIDASKIDWNLFLNDIEKLKK